MITQEIIKKAKKWALEEIEENGSPSLVNFSFSNKKGQELAEKLGGDKNLILLGTILMDIKLEECKNEGKLSAHTKRGAEATRKFLETFDIDEETKNKTINCVEAHHGTTDFICKEAEICANADCYRFLHPYPIFSYFIYLGNENKEFEEAVDQVELKIEEKWSILSLPICKAELEPYYKTFKDLIQKARER